MIKNKTNINVKNVVLIFIISTMFICCKNDIETVNKITAVNKLPSLVIDSLETIFSDSGVVKIKIFATEYFKFEQPEKNYDEYPKGINVEFYNDYNEVEATLTCRYARYFTEDELWEAKFDVVAKNMETEEVLNTELLYWDMTRELIYTPKYVKITTNDGPFNGEGFESTQDFLKWKILKPYATIEVRDE